MKQYPKLEPDLPFWQIALLGLGGFSVMLILVFGVFHNVAEASESDYQKAWCKGRMEVTLEDRTRVDCLTATHAIEIDFAKKWYEAIGQSLHYGRLTNKLPGIGLIVRNEWEHERGQRLIATIKHYKLPITVWYISELKVKE